MGYASCIAELVTKKEITPELGEKLQKAHNDNPTGFKDHINKEQKKAKDNLRKSSLAIQKHARLDNYAKSGKDIFDQISNLITRARGLPSKMMNVEFKIKQVHGQLLKPLAKHFDSLRSKIGGLKVNTKLLDNVTMVIFKGTGDDVSQGIVKSMEQTLKATNDMARQYGLKTVDDLTELAPLTNKIQGMTRTEFTNMVKPLVNNTLEEIGDIYTKAIDGEEIAQMSFKSGDALTEYQQKIGGGDPFSNLINYVDRKSAQIASAEVLGKNGKSTIKRLAKDNGLSEADTAHLVNMYEQATGTVKVKIPKSKFGKMAASIISGARALGTAAMMGSSPLTALLDIGTMALTARVNGLPMMYMYTQMVKNLVSRKSRMELAQVGFQLEAVMSSLSQTSRFNPHATTSDTLNKMATGVLRVSGLLALSDASKLAVKNSFLVAFKDASGATFEGLIKKNPKFLAQMKSYGITKSDWNTIRKSMKDDIMLNPMNLDDTVGSKVYRMINEEADTAVVTPGSRSAYWTSMGLDKGTLAGETVKSITQFKSTIVEQVTTHLFRAAMQQGVGNKLGYAAQYFMYTTVLGGMVYQLKELSKGNTPVDPMADPLDFFSESLKQGGAIPILTDSIIPSMMKPQFGSGGVDDLLKIASLNTPIRMIKNGVKAAVTGDSKEVAKAQAALAKDTIRMLPGNNLWYMKAFNEYAKSYIGYMIDSKGERKRQKAIKKKLKKTGQKQFIKP